MIIIFFLLLTHIPLTIYYDQIPSTISGKLVCTNTNYFFGQYNTYFNYLTLVNVIPYLITFSFGSMSYRNVQQLAYRAVPLVRRELDKQLTIVVLVQIVYDFVILIPNLIVYVIILQGNIQDLVIKAQINLIYTITLCFYYLYFSSPFYIYICVSERFRRQFIYVLFKMHFNRWRQLRIHPNQPLGQT
ncbi:unnamed protein product [Adineta ricciae]|uniref:G-protein coupled receptors family 1 profile domain-containing protein n=1 Tax=Adineta ricciae TaxID=249248 RepID=A0A815RFH5_ADIRI|nr:unnamed protein product [Adineta ricciae]